MGLMASQYRTPVASADERIAVLIRQRVRGMLTLEQQIELDNLLADRSRESRVAG